MKLLAMILGACLWCAAQSVEGTIANSVTHQGVLGAAVRLEGLDSKRTYSGSTDAAGSFRIANVAGGQYRATVSAQGYVGTEMNGPVSRDVRVNAQGFRLDMQLVPAARVSGRVMDPDWHPVRVQRSAYPAASWGATRRARRTEVTRSLG